MLKGEPSQQQGGFEEYKGYNRNGRWQQNGGEIREISHHREEGIENLEQIKEITSLKILKLNPKKKTKMKNQIL